MSKAVLIETGWMPIHLYFCPDEMAWQRLMRTMRCRSEYPTTAGNAAHFECAEDGRLLSVITVADGAERRNGIEQITAVLAHEAVHIFQRVCQHIGEDKAGSEVEAYIIQDLTLRLIQAFKDTRMKRKAKRRK
jgi:hypothetical protein